MKRDLYIKKLHLVNYRLHKKLDLEFSPRVNILFGENGAGKSTILEAVSHALSYYRGKLGSKGASGTEIKEEEISTGEPDAGVVASLMENGRQFTLAISATRKGFAKEQFNYLREATAWAAGYMEKRSAKEPVGYPLLAHYKVNRSIIRIPQRQARVKNLDEPLSGYEQSLDGGGDFRGFFAWFREMEDLENERFREGRRNYRSPELEAVRHALQKVLPGIGNIHIRRIHQAMVAEKNGVEISVSQLSDGEKCYLALVGDIASRLARLNVLLRPAAEEILQSPGIVLIDELDLHLHTKWQQEAIRRLPQIFPNIQFIITTHSLVMVREMHLVQQEARGKCFPVKYFSLYEDRQHRVRMEVAENLSGLRHFSAADMQLNQDITLLKHTGYEVP